MQSSETEIRNGMHLRRCVRQARVAACTAASSASVSTGDSACSCSARGAFSRASLPSTTGSPRSTTSLHAPISL